MDILNNYNCEAVVAMDNDNLIGSGNTLPWSHEPLDMKRFKGLTEGHAVLMGRNTWNSLPEQYRPLPNRQNFILTSDSSSVDIDRKHGHAITSVGALKHYLAMGSKLFVIGGATLYKQTFPYLSKIHLTKFNYSFAGNVHLDLDLVEAMNAMKHTPKAHHFSEYGYSFEFTELT